MEATQEIETIVVPDHGIPHEQTKHISEFKRFDWSKGTKEDAVMFARAKGFKETGMSVNEVALLYDMLEKRKPKTIVELGRNFGCSTRLFMQHVIRHEGCQLDSWDLKHWDGLLEGMDEADYKPHGYDERVKDGKVACFEVISEKDGTEMHEMIPVTLRVAHSIKTPMPPEIVDLGVDFLLIDTEHGLDNAVGEYMRWRYYLNGGAFIAFHDSTLPAIVRSIEIVKEIENAVSPGKFAREYVNERVDGFGVHILEYKG